MGIFIALAGLGCAVWACHRSRQAVRTARAALATLAELIDLVESVAESAAVVPEAVAVGGAVASVPPVGASLTNSGAVAAATAAATAGAAVPAVRGAAMARDGAPRAEICRKLGISHRELQLAIAMAGSERRAGS